MKKPAGYVPLALVLTMTLAVSGDVTSDVKLRLFEAGDDWEAEPGAMLWESQLFEQMNIHEGSNLYDFDVPSVRVADSLTWTLELRNADPGDAVYGSRVMNRPVVGSSGAFFWRRNPDGTWSRFRHDHAPSFGARIEAVPEPGTLTPFALCAAAMPWHRRPGSRSASSETYKNGDKACPDHGLQEGPNADRLFSLLHSCGCWARTPPARRRSTRAS